MFPFTRNPIPPNICFSETPLRVARDLRMRSARILSYGTRRSHPERAAWGRGYTDSALPLQASVPPVLDDDDPRILRRALTLRGPLEHQEAPVRRDVEVGTAQEPADRGLEENLRRTGARVGSGRVEGDG